MSVDAWLDGALEPEERVAFEARLARDPELRAELARAEAIEASLRRSFAPPVDLGERARAWAGGAGLAAVPGGTAPATGGWGGLAAAAALVLLVGLVAQRVAGSGCSPADPGAVASISVDGLVREFTEGSGRLITCNNRWGAIPLDSGETASRFTCGADGETDGWAVWGAADAEPVLLFAEEERGSCSLDFDPAVYGHHRRELEGWVLHEVSAGESPVLLDRIAPGRPADD